MEKSRDTCWCRDRKPARWWLLFCSLLCLLFTYTAFAEERAEDLAGDQEAIPAKPAGPTSSEPERKKDEVIRERPILKLPEVIVQGDRQYRVTAERKDLLLIDPMWGTKEMPADLSRVSLPGLEEEKEGPQANTITAKNYLLLLEAGAGTSRLNEGRLVGGYEVDKINAVLRADYTASAYPAAYGINPYDQQLDADLDLRVQPWSDLQVLTSITAQAESNRLPTLSSVNWGDEIERIFGSAAMGVSLDFNQKSNLKINGHWGQLLQQGSREDKLRTNYGKGEIDWVQSLSGLTPGDMEILLRGGLAYQQALLESKQVLPQEYQETFRHLELRTRFRPISALHLELGVLWNDLQAKKDRTTSHAVGQASLILPTDTTLYTSLEGGLRWQPAHAWLFEQSRPALGWWPGSELIKIELKIGWRQRWSEIISTHLVWFRRQAQDTPVWIDEEEKGLFSRNFLPATQEEGKQFGWEIYYLPNLSQLFTYTYRETNAENQPGGIPYLPKHEGSTQLRLEMPSWNAKLIYQYLGERSWLPQSFSLQLAAVHWVGFDTDWKILPGWFIYLRLENILNNTWQKWWGYPERGLTVWGGMRFIF